MRRGCESWERESHAASMEVALNIVETAVPWGLRVGGGWEAFASCVVLAAELVFILLFLPPWHACSATSTLTLCPPHLLSASCSLQRSGRHHAHAGRRLLGE